MLATFFVLLPYSVPSSLIMFILRFLVDLEGIYLIMEIIFYLFYRLKILALILNMHGLIVGNDQGKYHGATVETTNQYVSR